MKRLLALAGLSLLLVGCGGTQVDTFADNCDADGGTVLEDSTTKTVTSVNTGSGGGVGVGTSTTTVRLCIVDGDIVNMEVR